MQFKQLVCVLVVALAMMAALAEAHGRMCKHIRVPWGDVAHGPCNECCEKNGYSSWYAGPITRGCGCTNFVLGG